MTPKIHQMNLHAATAQELSSNNEEKRPISGQTGHSTVVDKTIKNQTATSCQVNITGRRLTGTISPATFFLIATPLAMIHPVVQFFMFLLILVSTSPLYFIIITFAGQTQREAIASSSQNHQVELDRHQKLSTGNSNNDSSSRRESSQ